MQRVRVVMQRVRVVMQRVRVVMQRVRVVMQRVRAAHGGVRHLDDVMARTLAEPTPATDAAVYQRAATADLSDEREAVKLPLTRTGVRLLEAPSAGLAVATVNRYLEIKAARAL